MSKFVAVVWIADHIAHNQYSATSYGTATADTPEQAAKLAFFNAVQESGESEIDDPDSLVDLKLDARDGFTLVFEAEEKGRNDGPNFPVGIVREIA